MARKGGETPYLGKKEKRAFDSDLKGGTQI